MASDILPIRVRNGAAGIALLGALASSWLLLDDRWISGLYVLSTSGLPRAGEARTAIREVRRRTTRDFLWTALKPGDAVFSGDSVYTGPGSEAELKLDGEGQAVIRLGPNSLAVVRREGATPAVEIRQGRVDSELGPKQKLQVTTPAGRAVTLEGASDTPSRVTLDVPARGGSELRVLSGSARVGAGGKESLVEKRGIATFTRDGAIGEIRLAEIEALAPQEGDSVFKSASDAVGFAWEMPNGSTDARVVASLDPAFRVLAADLKVSVREACKPAGQTRSRCAVTALVRGVGPAWWRVEPSLGQPGPASHFALLSGSPPAPLEPSYGAVIETGINPHVLKLEWSDSSGARKFQVQVGRDPEFKSVTHDLGTDDPRAEIRGLSEGEYHWRVRASEGSHSAKWSSPSRFHLQSALLPDAPAPASPQDSAEIAREGGEARVELTWEGKAGQTLFVAEIAGDARFTAPIAAEQLPRPSYVWHTSKPGSYWWRVRAVAQDGRSTVFSTPRRFDVK